MDIPVPRYEDLARVWQPCDHLKPQTVQPCADCVKSRVDRFHASVAAGTRKYIESEAAAWKQAIHQIELLAKASSERMQEFAKLAAGQNVQSIVASCQHAQPQVASPCQDCLKRRVEAVRTIMSHSIKKYGDEERAPLEPAMKKAQGDLETASLLAKRYVDELARERSQVDKLRELVRQRDRTISDMEARMTAERGAAAGYYTGPSPKVIDE